MFANIDHPVKLPVFEGPLDLLLFLIRKQEIDIYDIPIETLTRQYIGTLAAMEEIQLDVAGEFFVMAATLMEIKSRMLLPKHQQTDESDEEEEFDPRWELVHQLLEYQKFKQAAGDLRKLAQEAAERFPRLVHSGRRLTAEERPLRPSDKLDLWYTFNHLLKRLSERLVLGEITAEKVTVSDQMEFLIEKCKTGTPFRFSELFESNRPHSARTIVATFLALLELIRMKKIRVEQTDNFTEIECFPEEDSPLENTGESARLKEND